MDDLKLKANKRKIQGKKVRFLRKEGFTPIHLFGHNIDSQALQCDTIALQNVVTHAGMTRVVHLTVEDEKHSRSVFIREIQRNPLNRQLLHVDFYQIRKGEKMRLEIPIVLVGEAPAMKEKGRMLTHPITTLHIECLPENIPSQIEIDLSPLLGLEEAIHVKDIVLDPDITIHDDPEQLVVKVSEARVKEAEAVAAMAEEAEVAEAAEAGAPAAAETEPPAAD